ncbi:hypothetical protein ACFWDI_40685 [Streptomyces sp. NPDC060064]|uniref:hypothetical protein n=1 Tax=Streptomyces sp. NPDC060064 TaxID=3347049 RepID=UPI0036829D5C
MAQCQICGTELVARGRGRTQRNCSAACRQKAYRRRRAAEFQELRDRVTRQAPAPDTALAAPRAGDGTAPARIRRAGLQVAELAESAARRAEQRWDTTPGLSHQPRPATPEAARDALSHWVRQLAEAIRASAPPSRNEPAGSGRVPLR